MNWALRYSQWRADMLVEELRYPVAACTLSTGQTLLSEHIERAEFYPCGSVPRLTSINGVSASHEEHFLYIHAIEGASHVRGIDAAQDATALEQVGVRVNRRPILVTVRMNRGHVC
jgi:hypothetical protein